MKKLVCPVVLGCMLLVPAAPVLAQAETVTVGINLGHAQSDTVEHQTTLLNDLKAAGVHVSAPGLGPTTKESIW